MSDSSLIVVADQDDEALGAQLREMRLQKKLRLREVAEGAGISMSMLSQIERGISSPSIRMLRNICHALGVDGASFFSSAGTGAGASGEKAAAHAQFVVRAAAQRPLKVHGITKYRLTPAACSEVEGFLIEIGPGAMSDLNFVLQAGDKLGYVLTGRLRLFVDDMEIMLEAGDAYGFPSGHRYRWENGWESPSSILVVNTRHFYV
ncbi:MAG: XRE family transcriptional regulator [Paraburkholderia sp.]|jgi:transcriptional regulator with XRE-family HTH domain|nr:XRE family transcriptional regulator [Paraburkholderia sp.]